MHYNFENDRDVSVLRLASLLDGRENLQENIDLFALHNDKSDLDWNVVIQEGLIYPVWVITELKELSIVYPEIYEEIISNGINYKD